MYKKQRNRMFYISVFLYLIVTILLANSNHEIIGEIKLPWKVLVSHRRWREFLLGLGCIFTPVLTAQLIELVNQTEKRAVRAFSETLRSMWGIPVVGGMGVFSLVLIGAHALKWYEGILLATVFVTMVLYAVLEIICVVYEEKPVLQVVR